MLRPLSTLELSNSTLSDLQKQGIFYVGDLFSKQEILDSYKEKNEILKQLQPVSVTSALDYWQQESQREFIPLFSSELNRILGNGFQCGVITEICGSPFSGKTQICVQLCISVQLEKNYGGLNGKVIYIDTRNGVCPLRFMDIIASYKKRNNLNIEDNDLLKNVQVLSPLSDTEFLEIVNSLSSALDKEIKNIKQVRLIIVDSLSMPIQCCIDDPFRRKTIYSNIMHKLHELSVKYNVAVVVTSEMVTQMDKDGSYFSSAGGQNVSNYIFMKLELSRIINDRFSCRLLKSPIMPQTSITFMITEDGIIDST